MRFIALYFICFFTLLANDHYYTPKDKEEELVLNKFRKEKIILGLSKASFYNEAFNNNSINLLIEDLFKDYLGLNVQVVKDNWNNLYTDYLDNKIDVLGTLTRTPIRNEFILFSNIIIKQKLSIGSNDHELNSIKDLKNETIYLQKNSIYNDYLFDALMDEDIHCSFIYVDNIARFQDKTTVATDEILLPYKSKLDIGNLPGVSIGFKEKYRDLIPIINRALRKKYHRRIQEFLEIRRDELFSQNFFNSLTRKEKRYLKKLKKLDIVYEDNASISYYSNKNKDYFGSLVLTIAKISNRSNINFNIKKNRYNGWEEIHQAFLNGDIDVLPLAKNKERLEQFNFTKQIDYLDLYKVDSYNSKSKKIGVSENSIEKDIVSKYYLDEDIILFPSKKEIIEALKKGEIKSGFLYSYSDFNLKEYKVQLEKKIPLYLAVKKDNRILRDILNKAISNIVFLEDLKKQASDINNYNEYLDEKLHQEQENIIFIIVFILLLLFLLAIFRIIFQMNLVKKLKKDPLTGLPSRSEFNKLNDDISEGYAILIDIDNFKEINDKYGHYIGDLVIVQIAKIIKRIFSDKNSYRISGDEFYIFLKANNIQKYLDELKKEIEFENNNIFKNYKVGLSIGYFKRSNKNTPLDQAFRYADMAMYNAKNYDTISYVEATEDLINKQEREREIKTLLREEEIQGVYPVFQPKFCVKNNKILGAEALARWTHKSLDFISPGEFIPLAESIKLVHLIDYKIAEETIKVMKDWKNKKLVSEDFKISFNISMETFNQKDIVSKLTDLLIKYEVPGNWFEIELTESILSSNLNKTLEKLKELKNLNFQISIDDFSAGHSTANFLAVVPADTIKFDKSLLDIITPENSLNHSIYINLIKLVKDLNFKIVAEGVETNYQLEFLKRNSIEIAQGYIFSKPISLIEFKNKLLKAID